jgi:N-acetylneuraminate synthase
MKTIKIGNKELGGSNPCFIIAEIGINHNGDLNMAKKLIDIAAESGCNAVKFQKRTPDICVPEDQKTKMRETPWGYITYLQYKKKIEFEKKEYDIIDAYCKEKGIYWTASCWDIPSVEFINQYKPAFHKIPSAMLTDEKIISAYKKSGIPMILSTGMSSLEEIDSAAKMLSDDVSWMFLLCTSTYPAANNEINLKAIEILRNRYNRPVGYSGHEIGLQISLAAAALGASVIERHITLDRATWGTDHSASLEPKGLKQLIRDIRVIEAALGDGNIKIYDSEIPIRAKLRG